MSRAYEWVMAGAALLVVPLIMLEDQTTDPTWRAVAATSNWVIWAAFVAEFVVGLQRAPDRGRYLRSSWFDLAIIAVSPPFAVPDSWQGLRAARAVRAFRLLRAVGVAAVGLRHLRSALGRRQFHWILAMAASVVLLGAAGVYYFEARGGGVIRSFPDSVWWAMVTATTVGYGDLSPVTFEGRVIAGLLMLTGIGVIGIFTANVASLFFEQDTRSLQVEARLMAIEHKLDALLAQQRDRRDDATP